MAIKGDGRVPPNLPVQLVEPANQRESSILSNVAESDQVVNVQYISQEDGIDEARTTTRGNESAVQALRQYEQQLQVSTAPLIGDDLEVSIVPQQEDVPENFATAYLTYNLLCYYPEKLEVIEACQSKLERYSRREGNDWPAPLQQVSFLLEEIKNAVQFGDEDTAFDAISNLQSIMQNLDKGPLSSRTVEAIEEIEGILQATNGTGAFIDVATVNSAEEFFIAYCVQAEQVLNAIHAQPEAMFIDGLLNMGVPFGGNERIKHEDASDATMLLVLSIWSVVRDIRANQIDPQAFGQETWEQVTPLMMYDLAKERINNRELDDLNELSQSMQRDQLWLDNEIFISSQGGTEDIDENDLEHYWKRSVWNFFNPGQFSRRYFDLNAFTNHFGDLGEMDAVAQNAILAANAENPQEAIDQGKINTIYNLFRRDIGDLPQNTSQVMGTIIEMSQIYPYEFVETLSGSSFESFLDSTTNKEGETGREVFERWLGYQMLNSGVLQPLYQQQRYSELFEQLMMSGEIQDLLDYFGREGLIDGFEPQPGEEVSYVCFAMQTPEVLCQQVIEKIEAGEFDYLGTSLDQLKEMVGFSGQPGEQLAHQLRQEQSWDHWRMFGSQVIQIAIASAVAGGVSGLVGAAVTGAGAPAWVVKTASFVANAATFTTVTGAMHGQISAEQYAQDMILFAILGGVGKLSSSLFSSLATSTSAATRVFGRVSQELLTVVGSSGVMTGYQTVLSALEGQTIDGEDMLSMFGENLLFLSVLHPINTATQHLVQQAFNPNNGNFLAQQDNLTRIRLLEELATGYEPGSQRRQIIENQIRVLRNQSVIENPRTEPVRVREIPYDTMSLGQKTILHLQQRVEALNGNIASTMDQISRAMQRGNVESAQRYVQQLNRHCIELDVLRSEILTYARSSTSQQTYDELAAFLGENATRQVRHGNLMQQQVETWNIAVERFNNIRQSLDIRGNSIVEANVQGVSPQALKSYLEVLTLDSASRGTANIQHMASVYRQVLEMSARQKGSALTQNEVNRLFIETFLTDAFLKGLVPSAVEDFQLAPTNHGTTVAEVYSNMTIDTVARMTTNREAAQVIEHMLRNGSNLDRATVEGVLREQFGSMATNQRISTANEAMRVIQNNGDVLFGLKNFMATVYMHGIIGYQYVATAVNSIPESNRGGLTPQQAYEAVLGHHMAGFVAAGFSRYDIQVDFARMENSGQLPQGAAQRLGAVYECAAQLSGRWRTRLEQGLTPRELRQYEREARTLRRAMRELPAEVRLQIVADDLGQFTCYKAMGKWIGMQFGARTPHEVVSGTDTIDGMLRGINAYYYENVGRGLGNEFIQASQVALNRIGITYDQSSMSFRAARTGEAAYTSFYNQIKSSSELVSMMDQAGINQSSAEAVVTWFMSSDTTIGYLESLTQAQ